MSLAAVTVLVEADWDETMLDTMYTNIKSSLLRNELGMGEVVQLFASGTLKHNSTAGDGKNTHELLQSILFSQISVQDNTTLWIGAMFEGSSYAYW